MLEVYSEVGFDISLAKSVSENFFKFEELASQVNLKKITYSLMRCF